MTCIIVTDIQLFLKFSNLNNFCFLQNFTLANNETVLVPMMQRTSNEITTAKFTLDEILPGHEFQSVGIPYAVKYFLYKDFFNLFLSYNLQGILDLSDFSVGLSDSSFNILHNFDESLCRAFIPIKDVHEDGAWGGGKQDPPGK